MPIAPPSATCINAIDLTKSDYAVDGKRKTINADKRESTPSSSQIRQAPTERSDISALISHELTEMEKRIDDDDDIDSDNNNNDKCDSNNNRLVSAIKSTKMASTSTSIGSPRKTDCVGEVNVCDAVTDWQKIESIKPLQRLFNQSHVNETMERRRHGDCVQIPIERIELFKDDEEIIIVHEVSSVPCSVSVCFSVCIIANGIGSCI